MHRPSVSRAPIGPIPKPPSQQASRQPRPSVHPSNFTSLHFTRNNNCHSHSDLHPSPSPSPSPSSSSSSSCSSASSWWHLFRRPRRCSRVPFSHTPFPRETSSPSTLIHSFIHSLIRSFIHSLDSLLFDSFACFPSIPSRGATVRSRRRRPSTTTTTAFLLLQRNPAPSREQVLVVGVTRTRPRTSFQPRPAWHSTAQVSPAPPPNPADANHP